MDAPLPAPLPKPIPQTPPLPFAEPPVYTPPIPQPNVPKPVNILPPKPVGRPISVPFGYPLPAPRAVPVPRPLAVPLRPLPAAPGAGIIGALSKPLGIIGAVITAIQAYQFGCDVGVLPGAICPKNKPQPTPVPGQPASQGGQEPGVSYVVTIATQAYLTNSGPSPEPSLTTVVVPGPVLGLQDRSNQFAKRLALVYNGGASEVIIASAGYPYDERVKPVVEGTITRLVRLDGQPDPTAQPAAEPDSKPTPASPVPIPAPQPVPKPVPTPVPQPQPTPQPQPVPQPSPFPQPRPGQQPSPLQNNNPSGNPVPVQQPGNPQPAPQPDGANPTPAPQPVTPPAPVPLPAPKPQPVPLPIPLPVPQPQPDPRERQIPPPIPLPPPSDCTPCGVATQQATARLEREVFELKQQVAQVLSTVMAIQAAQRGHIQLDQAGHATNAGLGTANLTNTSTVLQRLGAQIPNGGVTGLMIRTYQFLQIDRVLNVLTYMATIHNALQLSNSIKDTLFAAVDNILATFGLKDEKGDEIDSRSIVNMWLLSFANTLFGAENVTTLSLQWKKWNRVYQAASNIMTSLQSIHSSLFEALETIGSWIAQISNALRASGTVRERLLKWLSPNPNFRQNRWMAQLNNTQELVSQIENVSSETRNIRETTEELTRQKAEFDTALANALPKDTIENMPKAMAETGEKTRAQSPPVTPTDLDNPGGF